MFPLEMSEFLSTGGFIETHRGQVIVFSGEWQGVENPQSPDLSGDKYCLYRPSFFSGATGGWYQAESSVAVDSKTFWSFLSKLSAESGSERAWSVEDLGLFAKKFELIQKNFETGLQKIVPVVTGESEGKISSQELRAILVTLSKVSLESERAGYSYGFWSQGEGVVGRTPEVLLKADLSEEVPKYSTMALAGTALSREKRSLLCDKKEMHEHQLVIDDISEQFEVFGKPILSETREVRAGKLKHLRTDIDLVSSEVQFEDLVQKIHPTPALGLRPRNYPGGEALLKSLCKSESRFGFGAPFAVVGDAHPIALVAIRNIHWDQSKTYLCSGCGIVPESQLENEWNELGNKRSSVLEMLGLSQGQL